MAIELNDEVRGLIDGALASRNPLVLAVVTAGGKPRMSHRGSLQALSASQLGLWVRNVGGETLEGIRQNPNVSLLYLDLSKLHMLQFTGQARVATDAAERNAVYERAPEGERNADPERRGEAVIIDLEGLDGFLGKNAEGVPNFVRLPA